MNEELLLEILTCSTQPIAIATAKRDIAWVNEAFCDLLGADEESLVGQDPAAFAMPGWKTLFTQQQLFHIESTDHAVKLVQHETLYLESGNDNFHTVHYYFDQSEKMELSRQLTDLRDKLIDSSLRDPLTGLLNMRAYRMLLEPQIARCRRYHTSLLVISLKPLFTSNQENLDMHADHMRIIARELKDILRWADQINIDEFSNFIVIAPETGIENSDQLVEKIRGHFQRYDWFSDMCFGFTLCNSNDDAETLIKRSIVALKRSRSAPDLTIKL